MKKILVPLFISVMICLIAESCRDKSNKESEIQTKDIGVASGVPTFFGDSTLTVISSNKPNGYSVKIFQTKDLTLLNLSRGDSINQYIAIQEIPSSLIMGPLLDLTDGKEPMTIGTYIREIDIPIEKDIGKELFFMDVNFDGNDELLIRHPGYNRNYYACFDIVHGEAKVTPGILSAMDEPPFNNIVSCDVCCNECYTEFDYNKKTIHIFEQMGAGSYEETWCEMTCDYELDVPKIRIVRREDVDYYASGYTVKTIFKRIDGELKEVSSTREKL